LLVQVGSVAIIGVTVSLLGAGRYLLDRFETVEQASLVREHARVEELYEQDLASLGALTRDWAHWDDAYAYVLGTLESRQAFEASNFSDMTFVNLGLDLVVFLDHDGVTIFRWTSPQTPHPISEVLLRLTDPQVAQASRRPSGVAGLIDVDGGLLQVAAVGITDSEQAAASHGVLVFGRWLDAAAITELSRQAHTQVAIGPSDETAPTQGIDVRFGSDTTATTVSMLADLEGRPLVSLVVTEPRSVLAEARRTLYVIALIALIGTATAGAMAWLLIERFVLKRVHRLASQLGAIASTADSDGRVVLEGDDELSDLARDVNRTLEALQSARRRGSAAQRLAVLVESSDDAIIGTDRDGNITSWNPGAERLYGYTRAEVFGRPLAMLAPPDFEHDVLRALERMGQGEHVESHETTRQTKLGRLLTVSVSAAPVFGENDEVVGTATIHRDVTAQREAEHQQRRTEQLFRSVFESGVAQAITDTDGRFLEVNDALCELLGYSAAELTATTVTAVTAPVDRDRTQAYYDELRRGVIDVTHVTKRYQHRSGREVIALTSVAAVTDADGIPTHTVGVVQDISQRVADEERLADREAMLSAVTSASANILTMYDTSGGCLYAAGAGLASLGVELADLIGSNAFDRYADAPDVCVAIRRALRGEAVDIVTTFQGRTYDARYRPVFQNGEVVHVVAATTDVSERARAEVALASSEERFRQLVQHASDVILQIDRTGTITYASPSSRHLLGRSADDLVGTPAQSALRSDGAGAGDCRLDELKGDPRTTTSGECTILTHGGGRRDVEYQITNLLDDPAIEALVVNLRDVTERRRVDEERRRHAEELECINAQLRDALKVRDDILAATTHELRTPLTPLLGILEIVRSRWDELTTDRVRELLQVVDRNAQRLDRLVADLLLATRLRTGGLVVEPRANDLHDHLAHTLALWPSLETTDVAGPDVNVHCDPDHLDQILTNLASNAAKYGRAPYRIDISPNHNHVTVTVSDSGEGVPPEFEAQLFEPFAQASVGDRRTATGMGLGLSIARSLARANGGDLGHDATRRGGVFILTLPKCEAAR
jgi:PAS domain S-box-containing protein